MNFERLPKYIFLDILGYLNVIDRVRAQSVNKLWYEMCTLAITERPISFQYFFSYFKNIPMDAFRHLLHLCHNRLSYLRFVFDDITHYDITFPASRTVELLSIMAEFNYPKLNNLIISQVPTECVDSFLPLIGNALNFKILYASGNLGDDFLARLPENSCSMLEYIQLYPLGESVITSATFRFLGRQCKNLKSLLGGWEFETPEDANVNSEMEDMNYFFGECAQLRHLIYHVSDIFTWIPNFWRLQFLEKISVHDSLAVDDTFLRSLSVSFPLLSKLEMRLGHEVTAQGVACLDRMQNLQKLRITSDMSLVLSSEFDTVVDNLGRLMRLTVDTYYTDAAGLKEAATKFIGKNAFLSVAVSDAVKNVIPVLEYLVNAGIDFECLNASDETGGFIPWTGSIPELISDLKNLEPDTNIELSWKSV